MELHTRYQMQTKQEMLEDCMQCITVFIKYQIFYSSRLVETSRIILSPFQKYLVTISLRNTYVHYFEACSVPGERDSSSMISEASLSSSKPTQALVEHSLISINDQIRNELKTLLKSLLTYMYTYNSSWQSP